MLVEQEQLRNCTFRPAISRAKSPQTAKSSAAALEKSGSPSGAKIRSKDLMPQTGDKCKDLYLLSKNLKQIRTNQDRTTEEVEFSKQAPECTFKPQTNA